MVFGIAKEETRDSDFDNNIDAFTYNYVIEKDWNKNNNSKHGNANGNKKREKGNKRKDIDSFV